MHEVLVNRLFKLAHEKVWLGELTLAVDLGRKATKQTKNVSRDSLYPNCTNGSAEMDKRIVRALDKIYI